MPSSILAELVGKKPKYGLREDGTPKGRGYFGEIKRRDDPSMISTELSATGDLKDPTGKPILYPLIVPTLNKHEIDHLINGGKPTEDIYRKAEEHAAKRLKAKKSPFADDGEQVPLPKE